MIGTLIHRIRPRLRAIAGIAILLLAGPALAQPNPSVDMAVWTEQSDGAVVHKPTDAAFPTAFGIFRRSRVAALAPDGSDAAISYDAQDGESPIRITIFLFRPQVGERGLKGALEAIAGRSPQSYVWAAGPFAIPSPGSAPAPLRAFKGIYKTGEGPEATLDYLYLAELGKWSIKVRATIAAVNDPSQEEAIDIVVRDLPWAAILKANGPCDGPACKTTGAVPFDSHMAESLLPNLLLKTTEFDPTAERGLPVVGRAQTPPLGNAAIRRATTDPLVYVAQVKDLGTFRLVKLPEALRNLVDGAFGRLSVEGPVYGVVIDSGGAVLMPRLFTGGEPTPAQFGEVVSELVLHSTASPFVTVKETAAAMPQAR